MEDYKKKLKEALDSKSTPFEVQAWIEEHFPSLIESEDERIRKSIIELLNEVHFTFKHYDINKMLAWLEKQGEQKPAEWSEEDESNFQNIDSVLFYDKNLPEDTCMRLRNWLQSLRPHNRWNPSDEQMEALNEVLNFAANHESPHWNDYIFGTLNNFIRQLKKLREG